MGYLIEAPAADQIVTTQIFLDSINISKPSIILDIPEYPAVPGYFWQTLYMSGEIVTDAGSTPYIGTSLLHIQAAAAPNPQLRFIAAYMQGAVGTWDIATYSGTGTNTKYAVNSNLQIHNSGTLTIGDTGINIYIGAILIKY